MVIEMNSIAPNTSGPMSKWPNPNMIVYPYVVYRNHVYPTSGVIAFERIYVLDLYAYVLCMLPSNASQDTEATVQVPCL